MTPNPNEIKIQNDTIELLKSFGYNYISPSQIKEYKEKDSDIVLSKLLKNQLEKINSFIYMGGEYKFSQKNIQNAIKDLDISIHEGLEKANQIVSDNLVFGKSYEEHLKDGNKRSFSLKYIDFEDIQNNRFDFTSEYVIENKRIDIVIFINGIPIGAIELKANNIECTQAISQMIRNQKEIPHFFKYAQILIAGNANTCKYATVSTPEKFWGVWREEIELNLKDRLPTNLDKTIYGLFDKNRVLEFIKYFIIFDKGIKKIARYQQYFAIKKIIKRVQENRGGVIWHTQGSGKSLTMVMLTKILKEKFIGSKIVVVTDRKELDYQITDVFKNSEIDVKRANSAKDLINLLKSGASVITTLVHKFEGVQKENVKINEKIFVLVDESHRTQGGKLHKAMKKVFINGIYLAFTGTPLLRSEKSTYKKFGGEIHRYTIDEAVRDKAVVPLLYEGRMANQWINDKKGLDKKFERLTKDLSDEEITDLKRKWARFQKIASNERRLEIIAVDITEHFKKYLKNTPFKAMLATSSKYDALKYKKIFDEEGEIKSAVVISPPDTREGESSIDESNKDFVIREWKKLIKGYPSSEVYEEVIKDRFKKGDLELLIVVDKLLTGFDAPNARVLYIDKELREHNLLQAIARVNRLYDDKDYEKEYGLIIDYRGLLGELDSALTNYSSLSGFDEEDLKGAVFDIKEEISKIKTYYSHLQELFSDIKFKDDMESFELALEDNEKRKKFYEYLSSFAKALNLALSSEKIDEILSSKEIEEFKEALKFYVKLKEAVKLRYHEKIDFKKYESGMQKLLDTFISSDEVIEIVKPVDIFDIGFEKTLDKLNSSNAKADAILNAISAIIKEKYEKNPKFYENLSKTIEEILREYREKRISQEEKLKRAFEVKEELFKESFENYPKEINNKLERSLFDNLEDEFKRLGIDEKVLIEFIKKVVLIFIEISKKPDWQEVKRNELEEKIEDLLYEIEDEYNVSFNLDEITPKIIGVAIANS